MDTTLDRPLISPFTPSRGFPELGSRLGGKRGRARRLWIVVSLALIALAYFLVARYVASEAMSIPLTELSTADYPENPADLSVQYGRYEGRRLQLFKRDATHFDLVLEPESPHVARVVLRHVDLSLLVPSLPAWIKGDHGLEALALTEREWSRQQVSFGRGSANVEVSGGDGFEREHLSSVEIANNGLNAGLWEIQLFTDEPERKLYYQAWLSFPLGHYKMLFEANTGISYWKHWYRLEHWWDPQGTDVLLAELRRQVSQRELSARLEDEPIPIAGEQQRKQRLVLGRNLLRYQDLLPEGAVSFASFAPPGRYLVSRPWGNQLRRFANLESVIERSVVSPAQSAPLDELELRFRAEGGKVTRVIIGGISIETLPRLEMADPSRATPFPFGLSVPLTRESYESLLASRPSARPYYALLLDEQGRWLNHHAIGIDGLAIFRDASDPGRLNIFLLSYEREAVVAHVTARL